MGVWIQPATLSSYGVNEQAGAQVGGGNDAGSPDNIAKPLVRAARTVDDNSNYVNCLKSVAILGPSRVRGIEQRERLLFLLR